MELFSGLFGGGKKSKAAKPPPPPQTPDPTPIPTKLDEDVRQKEADKRRQRIAAAGRGGTILTQGQSLGGNATLLGRSTS